MIRTTVFFIFTIFIFINSFAQEKFISQTYDCINKPDTIDGQQIFYIVEEMPRSTDTLMNLFNCLTKNIDFPDDHSVFYGKMTITFVVDTLGNVKKGCILKSNLRDDLVSVENSLLNNIESLPKWIPGKQRGKKVPVRFTKQITFGL